MNYPTSPSSSSISFQRTRIEDLFPKSSADYRTQDYHDILDYLDEEFGLEIPDYENLEDVKVKVRTEVMGTEWYEELLVEVESRENYSWLQDILPETVREWSPVRERLTQEEVFTHELREDSKRYEIEIAIDELLGEKEIQGSESLETTSINSTTKLEAEG